MLKLEAEATALYPTFRWWCQCVALNCVVQCWFEKCIETQFMTVGRAWRSAQDERKIGVTANALVTCEAQTKRGLDKRNLDLPSWTRETSHSSFVATGLCGCGWMISYWQEKEDVPDGWYRQEEEEDAKISEVQNCQGTSIFSIFDVDQYGVWFCMV